MEIVMPTKEDKLLNETCSLTKLTNNSELYHFLKIIEGSILCLNIDTCFSLALTLDVDKKSYSEHCQPELMLCLAKD